MVGGHPTMPGARRSGAGLAQIAALTEVLAHGLALAPSAIGLAR